MRGVTESSDPGLGSCSPSVSGCSCSSWGSVASGVWSVMLLDTRAGRSHTHSAPCTATGPGADGTGSCCRPLRSGRCGLVLDLRGRGASLLLNVLRAVLGGLLDLGGRLLGALGKVLAHVLADRLGLVHHRRAVLLGRGDQCVSGLCLLGA